MLVPLVLLLPPIAAILIILTQTALNKIRYLALGASLIGLALMPMIGYGSWNFQWFSVGSIPIILSTAVTSINLLLLWMISLITPLILFYSFGFMDLPSEQKRFYVEMLAFQVAMLALAMSGNFILFFIAWEFLSITSYLLIGFWQQKEKAVKASRRVLTIIFIGDIALLVSIIMLFNIFGTLQFSSILALAASHPTSYFYLAVFMLVVAVFTKSAQFPFQEWLIDAMEGPTPVSAFLHSSTMVKAGVFAVALLLPLFAAAGMTEIILAVSIITAVIATLDAMRERHVKKVLAYSTIQEMSIMLIAISSNALIAGVYLFFAQSFYKALLFFSAGAAMKATDRENLPEMSGIKANRLVYVTTAFGVLSLAGFIPFDGFFAGQAIGSAVNNFIVYAILSVISLLTSLFIFRWFFMLGKPARNPQLQIRYALIPRSMKYSMAILAASTLIASAFFFYISGFLGQSAYYALGTGPSISVSGSALLLLLAAAGASLGYLAYSRRSIKLDSALAGAGHTGWVFTAFYGAVARFTYEIADGTELFDQYLSNALDSIGKLTVMSGRAIRHASVGDINRYMAMFIAGILLMLCLLYLLIQ